MNNQHPITPPPELLQQWHDECYKVHEPFLVHIANQAAQWGADQELEACCEWTQGYAECGDSLRLARRSKPPSLKEQAFLADVFTTPSLLSRALAGNSSAAQQFLHEAGFTDEQGQLLPQYQPEESQS